MEEKKIKSNKPTPEGCGYPADDEGLKTKANGRDGNLWIVVKKGPFRKVWKMLLKSPKGRKYDTHDNSGHPFLVIIGPKTSHVTVYKRTDMSDFLPKTHHKDIFLDIYEKVVKVIKNPQKVFIGKCKYHDECTSCLGNNKKLNSQRNDGNSILVKISADTYIQIGTTIFSFQCQKGDEIIKYHSEVAGSDLSYPIAEGRKYIYDMIFLTVIPKSAFPKKTIWATSSRPEGVDKKNIKKLVTKQLHKRLW
jgi:hypothetical protein